MLATLIDLAKRVESALLDPKQDTNHDDSTQGLLSFFNNINLFEKMNQGEVSFSL